MKKVVSLIVAVVLCMMLAVPAFATTVDFVPSITAKPAPGLNGAPCIEVKDEEDKVVYVAPIEDLVITPVSEVQKENGNYQIPEEIAQQLRDLYAQMKEPTFNVLAEVPELQAYLESLGLGAVAAENMVVTSLFDITVLTEELAEYLEVEGNTIELTFEVDIPDDHTAVVLIYLDGKWQVVADVTVNEDGTVTCVFDEAGPVSILMVPNAAAEENEPAATEENTPADDAEGEATEEGKPQGGFTFHGDGDGICEFNHWWLLLIALIIAFIIRKIAKRKKETK